MLGLTATRKINRKERILTVVQFLFCFSAMVDPTNLFRTKLPLFALLIALLAIGHYIIDRRILLNYILLMVVQYVSCCMLSFINEPIDNAFMLQNIFFFMTFLVFVWSKDLNIDKVMIVSSIIVSLISIFGLVAMYINPEIESILFGYVQGEETQLWLMARREFLGVELAQFFYKSTPAIIVPYSIVVYKLIYSDKDKLRFFIISILMFGALFSSAQRTIIGVGVLIPIMIGYKRFKMFYIFKIMTFFVAVFVVVLLYKVITEAGNGSTEEKAGHLGSYMAYYYSHLQYCLFGTGPGALFYSKGYNAVVCQTEWVYLDIFKMYGIVGGVIIMSFFLYPFKFLIKYRKYGYYYALFIGYAAFLLVSAQNPFLLASTGLIAMYYTYSEVKNPDLLQKYKKISYRYDLSTL